MNLLQLIESSDSIIDLDGKLRENDIEFSNCREYVLWLDKEWRDIKKNQLDAIFSETPDSPKLPTIIVKSDQVEYHLHGISHGWPFLIAPGWHPRKGLIDLISKEMQLFHKPSQGEDYLFEQGFHHYFNLHESQELKDIDNTKSESQSILKTLAFSPIYLALAGSLFAIPIILGGMYLFMKSLDNPKDIFQDIAINQKALEYEEYQDILLRYSFELELPQPLNLEKEYLKQKSLYVHKYIQLFFSEKGQATPTERSLWTTNELKNYAAEYNLTKLHYLGGMNHISEIIYFLENPNYSFEKLKGFKDSKDN